MEQIGSLINIKEKKLNLFWMKPSLNISFQHHDHGVLWYLRVRVSLTTYLRYFGQFLEQNYAEVTLWLVRLVFGSEWINRLSWEKRVMNDLKMGFLECCNYITESRGKLPKFWKVVKQLKSPWNEESFPELGKKEKWAEVLYL